MNPSEPFQIPPIQVANDLTLADLRVALGKGWADFRAHPLYGMFFASIYIAGGLVLAWLLATYGNSMWLIPVASGFPLIAPFTAVGLYEVSRRREAGLPLGWGAVLGALRGRGDDQLLMIGGFVFVGFTFWMILAHGIFAIFMSESGMGSQSLSLLQSPAGLGMLAVGTVTGAMMAFLFYAVTVISLPLLVDRDIDFLTAIIRSLRAVQLNQLVMTTWAAIIALTLFAAMVPAFLGLLVVLPVLGHATWHLYRRTVD
ncbi:DUF2189 domain-containing protein [Novosphingobium sp.]|uniref:DUF2189 domain-containing protein n=1 Tax=Novosphingobium sp. TaxID=1874826 RepID=UPI0025E4A0D2|nr:DUF2189 domain-containing protein [Novosphingobium sp.]